MPGALYGYVASVNDKNGVLDTERGSLEFDQSTDSMKAVQLSTHYQLGEKVAVMPGYKPTSKQYYALLTCPVRFMQEGVARLQTVTKSYARGANESTGTEVFFTVGRLSDYFAKTVEREAQDLRALVKPGDNFLYRAVPQADKSGLKAVEIMLSTHPSFRSTVTQLPASGVTTPNIQNAANVCVDLSHPAKPPVSHRPRAPPPVTHAHSSGRVHESRKSGASDERKRHSRWSDEDQPHKRSRLDRSGSSSDKHERKKTHVVALESKGDVSNSGATPQRLPEPKTVKAEPKPVPPPSSDELLRASKDLAELVFADKDIFEMIRKKNEYKIFRKAIDVLECSH